MIYCVCEDEGSCFKFWKMAFNCFLDDELKKSLIFKTSKGKNNLSATIMALNLTSKDTLIVLYDNIGDQAVLDFFLELECKQSRVGFCLLQSDYFCFEKLFLTYSDFEKFIEPDFMTEDIKDLFCCLREYSIEDNLVEELKRFSNGTFESLGRRVSIKSSPEHLCSKMLSFLLRTSKKNVYVGKSKDNLGACWFNSCNSINNYPYVCKNCCRYNVLEDMRSKLIHFELNSELGKTDIHFTDFNEYLSNN